MVYDAAADTEACPEQKWRSKVKLTAENKKKCETTTYGNWAFVDGSVERTCKEVGYTDLSANDCNRFYLQCVDARSPH